MPRAAKASSPDTARRILDEAEKLVQRRGFNGFSYADVAEALGITTASLHYHFAGKAQLGKALIDRYSERFFEALQSIEERLPDARDRLDAYAGLYAGPLRQQRLCLCGMLAADYQTLPKPMREAVIQFFDRNEEWLARVIEQGQAEGTLHRNGAAVDTARMLISGLEGAMLVARPYGEIGRFDSAARQLVASLSSNASS
jgi:TetR/AcrR family transcriptional repressor of nem operon